MKNLQLLGVVAIAAVLPFGLTAALSDDGNPPVRNAAAPGAYVPPVLREARTPDSGVFTLPVPPKFEDAGPPVLRHTLPPAPPAPALPAYPTEFVKDSVAYLESHLSQWDEHDAAQFLGAHARQRPALGDDGKPNGAIFAYADPLHHYREFELDFEGDSGKLRTVFVYPVKMSWKECRRVYGSGVATNDAGNGRTFYSYLSRRLDVLVDASGNVISLGIY